MNPSDFSPIVRAAREELGVAPRANRLEIERRVTEILRATAEKSAAFSSEVHQIRDAFSIFEDEMRVVDLAEAKLRAVGECGAAVHSSTNAKLVAVAAAKIESEKAMRAAVAVLEQLNNPTPAQLELLRQKIMRDFGSYHT